MGVVTCIEKVGQFQTTLRSMVGRGLTAKGASYRSQFVLEQEAFRGTAMSWG